MSYERPPEDHYVEKRFDTLMVQAQREIADALLAQGKEPDPVEAMATAEQMFEDRSEEATALYDAYTDRIGQAPVETHQDLARGLLQEMAHAFSRDGYMRDITAQRLAAVMIQLFDEEEDDEENEED